MKSDFHTLLLLFFVLCYAESRSQNGNPRHPGVVHFEELGRMSGSGIGALPDLNNDGRRDFAIGRGGSVWLYSGVVGGLPAEGSGVRLGPTESDSDVRILAVGDWDGMNGPDICTRIELKGDTSFGNTGGRNQIFRVVVFWNQGEGEFTVTDTTHLSSGYTASFGPLRGTSFSVMEADVEGLCLHGSGRWITNGSFSSFPRLYIYQGHSGGRWGRSGISNTPDWQWWNAPNTSRLDAEDLDQDGVVDFSFVWDGGGVAVLYGNPDGLPDTTDVQSLDLWNSITSMWSLFADVTGDAVPDLCAVSQTDDLVRIYVGCTGQRLLEQFGTGNDPPGGERWWGKPWAALKGPNHVSNAWLGFGIQLFDLGSADTNSTEEIWVQSSSFFLCYEVSGWVSDGVQYGLDSIFDGEIYPGGTDAKRLGDIDGDGRVEFSLSDNGEIRIYRMAESVRLPTPTFWRVPACDTSLSVVHEQGAVPDVFAVEVLPNPSKGEVRVRWHSGEQRRSGEARITVHDVLGQQVTSFTVGASQGEAVWDASSAAGSGDIYYISTTIGDNRTKTIGVLLQ